jgi:hypothetical protein
MCLCLVTAVYHTIAKHFNFMVDSVPQGPLAYGTKGCEPTAKKVLVG